MPSLSDLWGAMSGGTLQSGLDNYLNAPTNAAQIQANAQLKAMGMQQGMFNTIVGQEQPFLKGGYNAEKTLMGLLGGGKGMMNTLEHLPGYQFAKQQGDMGILSQNSATGSALGGASLKAMSQYNTGLANSYYQNFFNNALGVAGMGQNAAGNLGTAGQGLGMGAAQAMAASGGSLGAGIMGGANNMATAASGIGSIIGAFV